MKVTPTRPTLKVMECRLNKEWETSKTVDIDNFCKGEPRIWVGGSEEFFI